MRAGWLLVKFPDLGYGKCTLICLVTLGGEVP